MPEQPSVLVLPQAERESLIITTSHKFSPELVSAVTEEQVIRRLEEDVSRELISQPEEALDVIHRASPKDDVFSSQVVSLVPTLPTRVEEETVILDETVQRRAAPVRESFDVESQLEKVTVDHVTAIITAPVVQAERELMEILTTDKILPEELSSLDEIELLRSSIAHDKQQHTRQEELEIIHRSAPKDELYSTITVHQELVGQPEVSVPSVQEDLTIITGKLILSTFIINSSLTNFLL